MTLGIHCDHPGCDAELWGLAFNAKPENWQTVSLNEYGDHMDYCAAHRRTSVSRREVGE